MAQFQGVNINISGDASSVEVTDALVSLNRSMEYQFANLDSENVREIGGWLVGPTELQSKSFNVGMSTDVANPVRFWAGGPKDTAPFRVLDDGSIILEQGTISWGNVNRPTYTAADVGALATNAPELTYIGPNGIYTGVLNANQINVGTLTGFTIQTSSNTAGARVILDQTGFRAYDSSGGKRFAIEQSGGGSTWHELKFYGEAGTQVGYISPNNPAISIGTMSGVALWLFGQNGLYLNGGTPFFDFNNVPIRGFNANLTAVFG